MSSRAALRWQAMKPAMSLSACLLAATLGSGTAARILVVGAGGTAQEILTAGRLEPSWQFTAVDPSPPMLDLAASKLHEHGLADRVQMHLGYVEDLDPSERFDAATLIGVLHHLPGDTAKQAILSDYCGSIEAGRAADTGRQCRCVCQPAAVSGRVGGALA